MIQFVWRITAAPKIACISIARNCAACLMSTVAASCQANGRTMRSTIRMEARFSLFSGTVLTRRFSPSPNAATARNPHIRSLAALVNSSKALRSKTRSLYSIKSCGKFQLTADRADNPHHIIVQISLLIVLFLFLLFLHHPSRGRREQRITWVNTNADISKRKTRSAVRRCLPRSRRTMSTCFAGATVAGTMPRYHRADWQRNSAPLFPSRTSAAVCAVRAAARKMSPLGRIGPRSVR